jgi:hypothetical protein
MGNGNSSAITINLDRTNSFYFTGETVSGTAELNVSEGKVEADEVYIQLTGEIGYTTTETVRDSDGNTSTRTDSHQIPFYSAKAVFDQSKHGQKRVVYGPGQYTWPFQISLADHLPPSIAEPLSYPYVRYYVQVVIDKPWYKPNKTETKYFTVYPHVNLLHNPQCLQATIFGNHNRKDITLRGTLNKTGYIPGELIIFTLEIENPRTVLIKHIDLSMVQSSQIGEDSRINTIFQTTLPKILNLKDQQIIETFSVVIPPVPMPPSYQFQGGIRTPALVVNQYTLKFVVKVEGMFTNIDVKIPITLGTEPNPDLNQQQTFNHLIVSYSSNPEQSMFSDDNLPPNYNSVVRNMK